MIPVALGKLRHRLEIQEGATSRNTYGEDTPAWSTVATRFASIEPLTGREAWLAKQVSPDVTHQVTMRHYDGLTPKHRLQFGTRLFEIESVRNVDELKRFVVCMCREQV